MTREPLSQGLARELVRAGLPRRTAHALRHGVATLMLADGVSMKIIAEQLGNSERVASDTYSHVHPDTQRSAIGVLDRAVNRG